MVSWCAKTMQAGLKKGTMLSIFPNAWGPNIPVLPLPAGAFLSARYADASVESLSVLEADNEKATVQDGKGKKWQLKSMPHVECEALAANTAGAPTTYWLVTDEIA